MSNDEWVQAMIAMQDPDEIPPAAQQMVIQESIFPMTPIMCGWADPALDPRPVPPWRSRSSRRTPIKRGR